MVQGIPTFKVPLKWGLISVGVEVLALIVGSLFSGIPHTEALEMLVVNIVISIIAGSTFWVCIREAGRDTQKLHWPAFIAALLTPTFGMMVIMLVLHGEFKGVPQGFSTFLYGGSHWMVGMSAFLASFVYTVRWTLIPRR